MNDYADIHKVENNSTYQMQTLEDDFQIIE